jgi:hypothetical protein
MNPSTLRASLEEIHRAIAVLFRATDVVEMRIPNAPHEGTVSGYYLDHEALAKHLASRNANGYPAIYVTMNPVTEALLARSANHVKARAKVTTSDKDISSRRWLLIDIDPVRPADISSNEAEHQAALERARDIARALAEEAGWPAPVFADSGNGSHLLYKIDLPNDETTTKLLACVLKALSARFSDAVVKIDESVYNAARIVKAYGTIARKGDDVPDRPHRLSRILEAPTNLEVVPHKLLEELAASADPEPPPRERPKGRQERFDVELFLARYLSVRPPVAADGGTRWVLEHCPFNPEHKDSAVFRAADGSLGFHCFHASCAGKQWRDVRALFEEPRARKTPDKNQRPAPVIENLDDLLDRQIPMPDELVKGIVVRPGVNMIVGSPKVGKTLLGVQMAMSVAAGQHLFDYYNVQQAPALIVEQDDRNAEASLKSLRQQSRAAQNGAPCYFASNCDFSIGLSFADWLDEQARRFNLGFILLDSYTALRGSRQQGLDIVKAEAGDLALLNDVARRTRCAFSLVHHDSKSSAALDWSDRAAGTYAVGAGVETLIFLSRFPDLAETSGERLMRVRGRRLDGLEMVLRFQKASLDFDWVLEGPAAQLYPEIQHLRAAFPGAFTAKEVISELGWSRATTYRVLHRLTAASTLRKRDNAWIWADRA